MLAIRLIIVCIISWLEGAVGQSRCNLKSLIHSDYCVIVNNYCIITQTVLISIGLDITDKALIQHLTPM